MRTELLLGGVLCFVTPTVILNAQSNPYDPAGIIRAQLEPLIKAQWGENFLIQYVPLDSLIYRGPIRQMWEDITDPYGTLRGNVLFWARPQTSREDPDNDPEDSTMVGMFRNNAVIWLTGPVCRGRFGRSPSKIVHTGDINRDGEVDILMISEERARERISFLWIFSWDGQRGRIINDIGQDGQSVIIGTDGMYDLFDIDDDGIMEIRTRWLRRSDPYGGGFFPVNNPSPKAPCVVYGWNGSLYGYWPGVPQVGCHEFFPANRLAVSVHCVVTKSGGLFDYAYRWKNDSSSKQKINDIWLANVKTNAEGRGPVGYRWHGSRYVSGFRWNFDYENQKWRLIKAGQVVDSFGLLSNGLPTIIRAFVQGNRPFTDPFDEHGNDVLSDETVRNDIFTNSVVRYTLGPADPPNPFVSTAFMDTITSYLTRSVELGWITTTPGIATSLSQKLANAKAQLQRNNKTAARNVLQAFLNEVEALWKGEKHPYGGRQITSEAYALLKFNAEYLISKL